MPTKDQGDSPNEKSRTSNQSKSQNKTSRTSDQKETQSETPRASGKIQLAWAKVISRAASDANFLALMNANLADAFAAFGVADIADIDPEKDLAPSLSGAQQMIADAASPPGSGAGAAPAPGQQTAACGASTGCGAQQLQSTDSHTSTQGENAMQNNNYGASASTTPIPVNCAGPLASQATQACVASSCVGSSGSQGSQPGSGCVTGSAACLNECQGPVPFCQGPGSFCAPLPQPWTLPPMPPHPAMGYRPNVTGQPVTSTQLSGNCQGGPNAPLAGDCWGSAGTFGSAGSFGGCAGSVGSAGSYGCGGDDNSTLQPPLSSRLSQPIPHQLLQPNLQRSIPSTLGVAVAHLNAGNPVAGDCVGSVGTAGSIGTVGGTAGSAGTAGTYGCAIPLPDQNFATPRLPYTPIDPRFNQPALMPSAQLTMPRPQLRQQSGAATTGSFATY